LLSDWVVFYETPFSWPVKFGLALAVSFIASLVFRMLDVRQIRALLGWRVR